MRLHERCWRRPPPPGGAGVGAGVALALVHGFGEHGGRYGGLVDYFVARGYAVHALDLRGHGRSPGARGHIDAWRQYREDLAAFLAHVAEADPGARRFLYGHSLGGAIVLEYGLHQPGPVAGVIASAPPLIPLGVRSPVIEAAARVLSRLWPSFSVRIPLETAALSRRTDDAEASVRDPLTHGRLSARATTETLRALAWTRAHASEWRLPLLVLQGDADRIAAPEGSVAFVAAARAGGAPDVELRLYVGGYHEPHNDLEAGEVLADVGAWLARH